MKNTGLLEAFIEINKIPPTKSHIYSNSLGNYTTLSTLKLQKEFAVSLPNKDLYGIIPELKVIWFTEGFKLYFYNYFRNTTELVETYDKEVCFVETFKADSDIFSESVELCFAVATVNSLHIYAVEEDSYHIVKTDFTYFYKDKPTSMVTKDTCIYLGCSSGIFYKFKCCSIPCIQYKYLSVGHSTNWFIRKLSPLYKLPLNRIKCIAIGNEYAVFIGFNIYVYYIKNNSFDYKYTITNKNEYIDVVILDENPLSFYCLFPSGNRDFFEERKLIISKDFPTVAKIKQSKCLSDKFVILKEVNGVNFLNLISFNEDQLVNFLQTKSSENSHQLNTEQNVKAISINDDSLVVLTDFKISIYSIYTNKQLLLNLRSEEIYQIYKNYGDVYFMVKYFELLANNENVSMLEGYCKNDSLKGFALFIYLALLVKDFWRVDICKFKSGKNNLFLLEKIVKKLKTLLTRVKYSLTQQRKFIEEFLQTIFYLDLLDKYNITYNETFESILVRESNFNEKSLNELTQIFKKNNSIDQLNRILENNCSLYFPSDQMNIQRGFQVISGTPTNKALYESLSYFKLVPLRMNIIDVYNDKGFFYGSVYLIREKFNLNYNEAIDYLSESVRCIGAMNYGLEDTREEFLYPFFEVLVNMNNFDPCLCCQSPQREIELLKIKNPLFIQFLKSRISSDPKIYSLEWKYLAYNDDKKGAVNALIKLSERPSLSLSEKVESLNIAKSLDSKSSDIILRLKLYKIQKAVSIRKPHLNFKMLLSAESLLNDYCYNEPDLALEIFDVINYDNKDQIKKYYKEFIKNSALEEIFNLLDKINNKDLSIIMGLLIENNINKPLLHRLLAVGFEYNDILINVKSILMSTAHPNVKRSLLTDLKSFAKFNEFNEYSIICSSAFGI
ncbi:hypothetical protein HERIO_493 [Hepatospora eriocheir]|uniref:Uncharacterized protein n=1 Tax=Hepatospora eriocheir TaxID=1081669 RepID=A0A1X0QCW7_9MICR|nr:hypothetical protein HERIO_493 [Hepatospora eriocheir]